jgi:hypothetical protein
MRQSDVIPDARLRIADTQLRIADARLRAGPE